MQMIGLFAPFRFFQNRSQEQQLYTALPDQNSPHGLLYFILLHGCKLLPAVVLLGLAYTRLVAVHRFCSTTELMTADNDNDNNLCSFMLPPMKTYIVNTLISAGLGLFTGAVSGACAYRKQQRVIAEAAQPQRRYNV